MGAFSPEAYILTVGLKKSPFNFKILEICHKNLKTRE